MDGHFDNHLVVFAANVICGDGATAIAESLTSNTTLTELNLSCEYTLLN